MTHQQYRFPRAFILVAAGVWIGIALKVAPVWAEETPPRIMLKKGKYTPAMLKDELHKACREQAKPEMIRPAARRVAGEKIPPPILSVEREEGMINSLCQALGAGSEAPCSSAKKRKNECIEIYRTHQLVMLAAQNNSAAAIDACLRVDGYMALVAPGRQSEFCKVVVEAFQGSDVDGSCEKILPFLKPGQNKNKFQRDCVRGFIFLEGEASCDARTRVECESFARLRLAVKAQNPKECRDSVLCLAVMTHSADICASLLPVVPPKAPDPDPQKELEDYCGPLAADQAGKVMSDENAFRKNTGRRDYKDGDPLLHLLPPGELPPVPVEPVAPEPVQPPLDPPRKVGPTSPAPPPGKQP